MDRFSVGIRVSCLLGLTLVQVTFAGRAMHVSAPQARLYDAPASDAHIVATVPRGTKLVATGSMQEDWMQMEAPPSVSGWLFGELLRENQVSVTTVKIRSGPGVAFGELGRLSRGEAVHVIRKTESGWVEFEGLSSMRVWIERSMVSEPAVVQLAEPTATNERAAAEPLAIPQPAAEPPSQAAEPVVQAAVHPEPKPQATVVEPETVQQKTAAPAVFATVDIPAVARTKQQKRAAVQNAVQRRAAEVSPSPQQKSTPYSPRHRKQPPRRQQVVSGSGNREVLTWEDADFPAIWRPVPSAPQGELVQVEGELRPVGFGIGRPSAFRLVQRNGFSTARTIYYLRVDADDVRTHLGQRVSVEGHRFWLIGIREPILVVAGIQ